MEDTLLHIALTPYLAEWFIHEQGGVSPVSLRRNSPEAAIIERGLAKKPVKGKPVPQPPDANVAIRLPQYKSVDPRRRPYLPEADVAALKQCIRNKFLVQLWFEMHQRRKLAQPIQENVRQFMREHGIRYTDQAWETIRQTYYRMRDVSPKGKTRVATSFSLADNSKAVQ